MGNKKHFERLVIAAYRLPFKFTKTKNGLKAIQNSGGLVSAILSLSENFKKNASIEFNNKIVWTGVADNIPENFQAENFENEHFQINPVNIPSKTKDLFYGGFC